MQEIEDPELAQKRMKDIYKLKGYSDEWIEKRVRGVAIRDELTDEWDKRGTNSKQEYSILTAELILTMLGEATTTRFTRDRDSRKFPELRKDIEGKLGKSVVSSDKKKLIE